ncbi:hypothetical protein C0Z16_06470 [Paraburkholderia rhynchosiae]|uniref:Uncharacterized protein n=1 Tax=Paraburkholderia rhynchosiae TaxID=487049 RepID=A0ABX4VAF3_9BURK|nr:hypothetical protein C0Z16_06470 [Paraburkholderia rhynchosiae]
MICYGVVDALPLKLGAFIWPLRQSQSLKDEDFMDTHLMIGVAVMFGLIGIAASRDLLRRLREQQPQLAPIKVERPEDGKQRGGR